MTDRGRLRGHLAEAAALCEHRDQEAARVASARAVVLGSITGGRAVVHRTSYPVPNLPWRTTFLAPDDTPEYHLESSCLAGAVKTAMEEGYEIVEVLW